MYRKNKVFFKSAIYGKSLEGSGFPYCGYLQNNHNKESLTPEFIRNFPPEFPPGISNKENLTPEFHTDPGISHGWVSREKPNPKPGFKEGVDTVQGATG